MIDAGQFTGSREGRICAALVFLAINFPHGTAGQKCTMMKTCSRDLLQQMTETYKTRIAGTDDFRSTLDALFFTALRAARESDTLRQFDCFKGGRTLFAAHRGVELSGAG